MKPLLSIQKVPISIEYRMSNARVERVSNRTDVDVNRQRGGFNMRSSPIRVNIDTFEARNSIMPSAMKSMSQNAEKGRTAALQAIARFAEEGHILVNNTNPGNTEIFDRIFEARVADNRQFTLAFVPRFPASITWTPPDLNMEYELDVLTFNWQTNKGEFEFIPAQFETNVVEYPRVIIEYVGEPNYVPPSANPNYVPIDTKI